MSTTGRAYVFNSATVTIYADGTAIGSATATAATTTVTTDGEHVLTDGPHSITARQTEPGNPESPDSPALSITIDATRPVAPGVALAHDTGVSSTDMITKDPALTTTGTEQGAVVEYSVNGAGWSTTYTPGTDGAKSVQVRQTDVAGNVSPITTFSFTLDTIVLSVVSTTPSRRGGSVAAGTTLLLVTFSKPVTGGDSAANYELQWSGWASGYGQRCDHSAIRVLLRHDGRPRLAPLPTESIVSRSAAPSPTYPASSSTATPTARPEATGRRTSSPFPRTTFSTRSRAIPPAATTLFSLATGDLNGDGLPDLVVANLNSNTVGVLVGQSDGTFAPPVTDGAGGTYPCSVAIGDLNCYGCPDIAGQAAAATPWGFYSASRMVPSHPW